MKMCVSVSESVLVMNKTYMYYCPISRDGKPGHMQV